MTLAEATYDEATCSPGALLREPVETPLARPRGAQDIFAEIPEDFRLASGERLGQTRVLGRLHGRAGAPMIVVAGGISANRFVHRTEERFCHQRVPPDDPSVVDLRPRAVVLNSRVVVVRDDG